MSTRAFADEHTNRRAIKMERCARCDDDNALGRGAQANEALLSHLLFSVVGLQSAATQHHKQTVRNHKRHGQSLSQGRKMVTGKASGTKRRQQKKQKRRREEMYWNHG
jgi:hypothetical protein